jgi:nucleotide-binding universal stress UspA family protein
MWADAAIGRLQAALQAAWSSAPADVEFRPIVVRGETGDVLVRLADDPDDLLVVGTGRRGTVARLGHGRVSRYCLAHARCPVLAVPPAALTGRRPRSRRWESAARHELNEPTGDSPRREVR